MFAPLGESTFIVQVMATSESSRYLQIYWWPTSKHAPEKKLLKFPCNRRLPLLLLEDYYYYYYDLSKSNRLLLDYNGCQKLSNRLRSITVTITIDPKPGYYE